VLVVEEVATIPVEMSQLADQAAAVLVVLVPIMVELPEHQIQEEVAAVHLVVMLLTLAATAAPAS
tara:strand:- start:20 stop:214 length:195 start_codon:yes stop_codon:yes gene_type:complete